MNDRGLRIVADEGPRPRFVSLREAAADFGFRSGDAMRAAFRRGTLPERYLLRIGRACRVDVAGLAVHLRREAEIREAAEGATPARAETSANS